MTDQEMLEILKRCNQHQLIEHINSRGPCDEVNELFAELKRLNNTIENGIESYYQKGYSLIYKQKESPLNQIQLHQPKHLQHLALKQFEHFEDLSQNCMDRIGFVLVAGGFGERLGSNKIKIKLVCEVISQTSFLELYLSYMEKFSENGRKRLRLFLMTSEQTHQQTVDFLKTLKYDHFLDIEIKQQDKVFCFKDLDLNIAVDPQTLKLTLKPHGHGDVHTLLKNSDSLRIWREQNSIDYLYFFQDINPFSFAMLPSLVGVSMENQFDVNFLAVKIKPGEPYGTLITD